ncbi:MAG TPA: nuclease, partial [Ruminococcaceae bacterium]|nr:nuclease [Oscillospiraceae bacterium]
ELKAQGKKPRPLQVAAQKQLRKLGFTVKTLDSKEQVDEFCEKLKGGDAK